MSCIQIKITEFIHLKLLWFSFDCQHMKINTQHTIIDLFVLTKAPETSYFRLVFFFVFLLLDEVRTQTFFYLLCTQQKQFWVKQIYFGCSSYTKQSEKVILLERKEKRCFWKSYDTSWLLFSLYISPCFCPQAETWM